MSQGPGKEFAGQETAGSLPDPSPGQPVREEEVLLDVIDQGAPHFLHDLEDSLEVVKLQGHNRRKEDWSEIDHPTNCSWNTHALPTHLSRQQMLI